MRIKKNILAILNRYNTLIVLLLLIAFGGLRFSTFLSINNILNIFRQTSMLGIMSVGMTFVLLSGGVDLSVGAVMALSAAIVAKMSDTSALLGIMIAITASLVLGYLSGSIVARFNVPPFIATLGVMMATRGSVHILINARPYALDKINAKWFYDIETTKFLGMPLVFALFIISIIIAYYILKYKKFGREIYAVGGNEEAARTMGLNVKFVKTSVYMISGLCSGVSGLLMCSRLGSAYPHTGEGWEMNAIAAAVLGGTLLTGGVGNVVGTLFGAFIISIIGNLINLEGSLGTAWQHIINGFVLLIAIILIQIQSERSVKEKLL